MKRVILSIFVFASVLVANGVALSQDPEQLECDVADLKLKYQGLIESAQTLDDLSSIYAELGVEIANCRTLKQELEQDVLYTLEGNGSRTEIIGPIDFETGYYLFEYSSTWDRSQSFTRVNADFYQRSGERISTGMGAGYSSHEDDLHARTVNYVRGGSYFVEIETEYSNGWSITISPFDTSPIADRLVFSSSLSADTFGPFELNPGLYVLEYEVVPHPNPSWGVFFTLIVDGIGASDGLFTHHEFEEGKYANSELVNFEGGVYYLNGESTHATEWSLMLTPVE